MRKNVNKQLYLAWVNMRQRCNNKNRPDHKYYKDINVYTEWEVYENFERWSLTKGFDTNLTIDRIDNSKGYCPENCRWVSRNIQMQNTRTLYSHNKSGYRGIFWRNDNKKWRVLVRANNVRYSLGSYSLIEDAISCYNTFVIQNNLKLPLNYIKEHNV